MKKNIGITIHEVLKMEPLAESKVIAGIAGLNRLITSVNVMEVPDILDWVAPGELLITTAYSLQNNIEALSELIPMLNTAGVSGLGIKLKRYVKQIPQEVIDIADQLSFPIFEIQQQVPFSDIITLVLTKIVNKQNQTLEKVQELNKCLTSIMLNGGNLNEICKLLYERFKNSIAINSTLFSSYTVMTNREKRKQICDIIENYKKKSFDQKFSREHISSYKVIDIVDNQPCNHIIIPIYSDHISYGEIHIWEDFGEISSLDLSLIESVTSLIALDMMKRISLLEMENDSKTGFLNDLLSSDRKHHQKALFNIKHYGLDSNNSHCVIVIRPKKSVFKQNSSEKALYQLNMNIMAVLQRTVKNNLFKTIYANSVNTIIILCETSSISESSQQNNINEFIEKLHIEFCIDCIEKHIVIGIGREYSQTMELYKSLAEAKRALSHTIPTKNSAVFYENMGINRILSYDSIRAESELFCMEILKPLLDYDELKDSELLKTLTSYFKCKGNLTNLSENLKIHYNTVVYRLKRIKELTNLSFDDPDDLLNLQIALKLYEMKKHD